jgi:hypothetical protein
MDRRESLKTLGLTTISAGLLLEACKTDQKKHIVHKDNLDNIDKVGRYDAEIARLKKLEAEPDFFDEHEMKTITVLADIIIPKDEVSGSASDAGVPEFIAFIVKDMPEHQLPLRGGIKWLDRECLLRFGKAFTECNEDERLEIVKEIAYPGKAKPEMQQGVAFFSRMRDLTASGFYTTKMGIDDIGYVGNKPNQWEGVPKDILDQYKQYNLSGF